MLQGGGAWIRRLRPMCCLQGLCFGRGWGCVVPASRHIPPEAHLRDPVGHFLSDSGHFDKKK